MFLRLDYQSQNCRNNPPSKTRRSLNSLRCLTNCSDRLSRFKIGGCLSGMEETRGVFQGKEWRDDEAKRVVTALLPTAMLPEAKDTCSRETGVHRYPGEQKKYGGCSAR